ncbi:MAG: bifunctional phosphoribosylaminoimidazolecarboxamide formyltransferase/IMP cyclohydrolase [Dehalococcoidaceae bacterium]|nr:bifunctional phosphoribosylaminoimidazolecarboxamide formyltransferase/IMP cyclohydrolase [Dehalococcoidaceae bacterium]
MRAIISVSDKTGVTEFARGLAELGYEIFSTGGTKKTIAGSGVKVKSISDITGFAEILDGRVKTLHPMVHGGLLARRDKPEHMEEIKEYGIMPIDLVAVNLYPFRQTVTRQGATLEQALENIDIGGPTMIRASAKNFPGVAVVVDPSDYEMVLEKLKAGKLEMAERKKLAQKAFQHVAAYDTAIAQYLRQDEVGFPDEMTIALTKRQDLRYGENPHQPAAFYAESSVLPIYNSGITFAEQIWGKELSFNNFLDADAAWSTVTDFKESAVTVIKHTNPCGLAAHPDIVEAYRRAYKGDPVSAFGGIVAFNRRISAGVAEEMSSNFYEIVIAPEYDKDALDILMKKKNLRVLRVPLPPDYNSKPIHALDYRRVKGGLLVQGADNLADEEVEMKVVTKRQPEERELSDLKFAWKAVKHIKSNAIVLVKNNTMLGMGAGQPNRVVSVFLAKTKAGDDARGSVMASDAMFPFPDSVEQAAEAGVTAIIHPGGSIRDQESIDMADKHNIAMVFTGIRHFLH